MNNLLVICGPTATGKTSLGIKLAKKYKGEIVSADSRQVYRGMDIITGKDIKDGKWEMSREMGLGRWAVDEVPVWLLDLVNPDQKFNVADYYELAWKVIPDIWERGKLPIIVGGTGFYIKALLEGIGTMGVEPDWELRKKMQSFKVSELQKILMELDPGRSRRMNESDRKNPRRLVRSIEVAKNRESLIANRESSKIFDSLIIGLMAANEVLYQRIDKRVEERVRMGAEEEVRKLLSDGYNWENSVMGVTLGYREWQGYFEKKESKEEVIKKWQFAEHDYAGRQMTWFRKMTQINWFSIESNFKEEVEKKVETWYS